MATVVVLNGTSSSGKTTIARAFQEQAPTLFLNYSIDNILYALPETAIARIGRGGDISDLRLPRLVEAFYGCVNTLLAMGHDLVVDHAVTARYHAELLLAAVNSHEVLLVGIECPIDLVEKREAERGDRRLGLARQQQASIHAWLSYDLVVDTSSVSPNEAARQIVTALGSGAKTGLQKTLSKLGA